MMVVDFPYSRILAEPAADSARLPYVIGAMATPSHRGYAERLLASCRMHGLPLALFEVPAVHRSISPAAGDDLRFTKANFVSFLLQRHDRPVLYVDADCVFAQAPLLPLELIRQQADFAIFNWLAEEHTEAYCPVRLPVPEGGGALVTGRRFYRFQHSIDALSDSQLLCSGPVQWYSPGPAARLLLRRWQAVITRSPRSPDDKCLDLAFNNYPADGPALRVFWLDKSHARYAWWIYVKPVIDHPELPHSGGGFEPLEALDGQPRIHLDELREPRVEHIFPDDCLIDVATRTLLRLQDGEWRAVRTITEPLWL